ncbi:MAG: VWA domain-containing protein [Vicinamibacterales bacterium]
MKGFSKGALLCALLTAAASSAGAGAQDPPSSQDAQQPSPIFRTRVDLVRVDVTVIGRADDDVIADLEPGDFEIEEDGVPQKVETLQFVRLDGTRTGNTEEALEIRSPAHAAVEAARDDVRVFAIFLDDYHVDKAPHVILPLRQALKHLVEQFGPNDLIAVMDPLTPLSHFAFTRSHDDLLLRMAAFQGRRGELFPVRSLMEEAQLGQRNIWEVRAGVTISALGSLVTHLGGLREGRKSVLFVSQGPPLGRPGSPNHDRLEEVLQAANRGNVTVHVLDPRPLGASPLGGVDSLFRLYTETGGRAIINTNDHKQMVGRIIGDASAYYLLGYTPSRDMADGKFHKIQVKVKRSGVRVLARQGYWAPSAKEMTPDATPAVAEPGLVEALTDLVVPKGGRRVDVWLGASRGPDGVTRVAVSWEPTESTEEDAAHLVIVPVRGRGAAGSDSRTIAAVSAREGETLATFDLEPATTTTLRFTAQSADGEVIDQWHQGVEVPRLTGAPVALSTPRFLRARSAFEARALDRGTEPTPTASRRFRKTDRVVVDVECYAETDGAIVTAQLLNSRGERLTELNTSPVSHGRARVTLPLASVALGTYVLRLQARSGDHDAYQRSAFQVVP